MSATKLYPSALLAPSLDSEEKLGKKINDRECFNISVISLEEFIV